jgi:hypothetical protein
MQEKDYSKGRIRSFDAALVRKWWRRQEMRRSRRKPGDVGTGLSRDFIKR